MAFTTGLWHLVKCLTQCIKKVKVKVTLVQALRLCTGRTAHSGSRGIALLFHNHVTRRGWGVSVTPRPLFTPVKDPVPIVQKAGWAPGSVWTGAENLAPPPGIRSPDSPARSQSIFYTQQFAALSIWCLPTLSLIKESHFMTINNSPYREHTLGDQRARRLMVKRMVKKYNASMQTGFRWLRICPVDKTKSLRGTYMTNNIYIFFE